MLDSWVLPRKLFFDNGIRIAVKHHMVRIGIKVAVNYLGHYGILQLGGPPMNKPIKHMYSLLIQIIFISFK